MEQFVLRVWKRGRASSMRIFIGLCFALLLCLPLLNPASAFAEVRKADIILGETVEARGLSVASCPDIDAEYAYIVDEDGTVYFERDADTQNQIASITKIMTAVVALESVPTDTVITVSEEAAQIGESTASLQEGDSMTLSEALKALMVPSGNDAAQAIAESVGAIMLESAGEDSSDSEACEQAFVDAMNAKAAELGMDDTIYENAHGLDDSGYEGDQCSTAHDVAVLCMYAMQKDAFREVVSMETAEVAVDRDGAEVTVEVESTDDLLSSYDGACGIKTGYTDLAGACFAGCCNRDGKDLYVVVLNSTDETQRFTDTETCWDWVYDNTVDYTLANSSETTVDEESGETVPVVAQVSAKSWIDKTVDATLADPDQTVSVFTLEGNVSQSVEYEKNTGTIKAGDKVGTVTFKQHNEVIATVDLVATETVKGPNPVEAAGIFFKRLLANFTGAQTSADDVFLNEVTLLNDKSSN